MLGELHSMSIVPTCARYLFSHMQHAPTNKIKERVAPNKRVHQALDDFRWILKGVSTHPTRITELVPLLPSTEGQHNASGLGLREYGSLASIWSPGKDFFTTRQ